MLKLGDLIFVRGETFTSRLIEDITHSPYNHVALAISPDTLIEAEAGEHVCHVPASKYAGVSDVYRADLTPEQCAAIVAEAEKHLGEEYGYGMLFEELIREETGIELPWSTKEPICSVLVAESVRSQGLPLCPNIKYPAPDDIAKDGLYQYQFSY